MLFDGSLHTWTTVKLPSWMDGAQIARAYHVVMPPVGVLLTVNFEEVRLTVTWSSGLNLRTGATQAHATPTTTVQWEAKRPPKAPVAFSTFSLTRNGAGMLACEGEEALKLKTISRERKAIPSVLLTRWQVSMELRVYYTELLYR